MEHDSPAPDRLAGPLRSRAWLVVGVAAVAVYLAIGLHQLDVPGLMYDEAADAVPAIEVLHGARPTSQFSIELFGHRVPLMMQTHIGPTSTYLTLAAFALAGVSVTTLRVSQLLVGALSLVLFWRLARRWFGEPAAVVALALLATAPPFVWWSRAGINWTLPVVPLSLGMLLALSHWWRTRRPWALALGAGLFGAGLTTKILFVWMAAPLALWTFVVLGVGGIRREAALLGTRIWVAVVTALALGLAPMLVLNLREPGVTVRTIFANARRSQLYGHDNLNFLSNLDRMIRECLHMMRGDTGALVAPTAGGAGGVLLVVGLLVLIVTCARDWRRLRVAPGAAPSPADDGLRARCFLVLAMVTILPESTVSTSSISSTYLLILLPFAWLVAAVGLLDLAGMATAARFRSSRVRHVAAGVALAVAAVVVLQHLAANRVVHRHLARTGGNGMWSDAVNHLAIELESEYRDRVPIAMDWGLERSVTFLTEGRVRMREEFGYSLQPPADFADHCRALLGEPMHLYAFHPEPWAAFPGRYAILVRTAEEQHGHLRLVETLNQRDGHPNILLYSVELAP